MTGHGLAGRVVRMYRRPVARETASMNSDGFVEPAIPAQWTGTPYSSASALMGVGVT